MYEGAGGAVLGVVGLELYGAAGLLRSTAVAESVRGKGIAAMLVGQAVSHAREKGCNALYLLTLDADRYFERLGFEIIGNDDAPGAIRNSREFTTLCPASAVLMRRKFEL